MVYMTEWDGAAEAAAKKEKAEKLSETVTWKPEKKWKKGDDDISFVGVLVEAKIVSGNFGPTVVLNVEDDEGVVWTIWAGSKVFKDALMSERPAMSHRVRLTDGGKQTAKKAGGYDWHAWAVEAQERDNDLWGDMTLEAPRNEPVGQAADGMVDPF